MAGVASPMLRRNVSEGLRFLAGLAVGGLVAGMVLAVPVYLIGSAVGELVPETWRVVALVALAVLFGVLDLLDRTPHIWRQVPQRLVRTCRPARSGWSGGSTWVCSSPRRRPRR